MLYVVDPGPDGSLGDVNWVIDARKSGRLAVVIYEGVQNTALAKIADVVLPGAAWVEKNATYTNDQGMVQAASKVINPPGEAVDDWQILTSVAASLGLPFTYKSSHEVRAAIGQAMSRNALVTRASAAPASTEPLPLKHWLQASNPMERWKWDTVLPGPAAGQGPQRADGNGAAAVGHSAEACNRRDLVSVRIDCRQPGLPSAMRSALLIALLLAVAGATGAVHAQGRPRATVTPFVDADGVRAGSSARVALTVTLPEGLHVQSDQPRDPSLIPTVLTIEPPAGVRVAHLVFPHPTDFKLESQAEPLAVFEHDFVVGAELSIESGRGRGRARDSGPAPLSGVRRQGLLSAADRDG